MNKARLEAFSDGVIAIIITVMVLEMRVPQGSDLRALRPMIPVILSYVLSFVLMGEYWSNHHHLLHAVKRVNGAVLWANLHLLFWMSLTPFVTAWLGQHFGPWPVAIYGLVFLAAGFAYYILTRVLLSLEGRDSTLAKAMGRNLKGKISLLIYVVAIPLAFVIPKLSCALYALVAIIWFAPDRRIEKVLEN